MIGLQHCVQITDEPPYFYGRFPLFQSAVKQLGPENKRPKTLPMGAPMGILIPPKKKAQMGNFTILVTSVCISHWVLNKLPENVFEPLKKKFSDFVSSLVAPH